MASKCVVAVVFALGALSCSTDGQEAGPAGSSGMGGGAGASASGCEPPDPPMLGTLETRTVGSGSPDSCREADLRPAFEAGGMVAFDCGPNPVTISVSETLVVGADAHIRGDGNITLEGGSAVRILRTANGTKVILEGLTFRGGKSVDGEGESADGSGGAVHRGWQGHLHVVDCAFVDNEADGSKGFGGGAIFAGSAGWLTVVGSRFESNRSPLGGAIHTVLSNLTVVDTVFENNEATAGDGGGVYTDGGYVPYEGTLGAHGGVIELCGTRFVGNTASSSAAAGFLYTYRDESSGQADRLVVNRCEFRGNRVTTADPGLGGAIRIDADAYVANSLFVDNHTAGQGGAIWMGRGPAVFENVTFYANRAEKWGGAISYHTAPIRLRNCTIAKNIAGEGSDGLFGGTEATPDVRNTIFYDNGDSGPNRHCNREIEGSDNLAFPADGDDRCGAEVTSDPVLAPELADHGGFTWTLALGEDSPALDTGSDCPATDQRGEPRDVSKCDLGAFERN